MSDILSALLPLAEAFERLDVPYRLGGSLASSVHGMPRATLDIDIVADLREETIRPLLEILGNKYYADEESLLEAAKKMSFFNLVHLPTMIKIDIFLPGDDAFQKEALSRRRREPLEKTESPRKFPVATPEDVVLQKLLWFRKGGSTSERQWTDVLGVLKIQAGILDTEYMARWARELGISDLLERALEEAGI